MKTILTVHLLLISLHLFSQTGLNSSIVAYYPLEGTAADNSSNTNDGVIFGDPRCVVGINGNALLFDGIDDYIRVEHSADFESINNELTICGWAFPMGIFNDRWLIVLTKGVSLPERTSFSVIYSFTRTTPYLRWVSSDNFYNPITLNVTNSLPVNRWNFFAWRFDNGRLTIFLNDNIIVNHDFGFQELLVTDEALEIGRDAPGNTEFYHGILDEICLFDKALSDSEILNIYSQGKIAQNSASVFIERQICQGDNYFGYTRSGTYEDTYINQTGCDSMRILELDVVESLQINERINLCDGEGYEGYFSPGIYRDTFVSQFGCDSIRIINLRIFETQQTQEIKSICEGESYQGYTTPGVYVDTLVTQFGCDSIRTLELTVLSPVVTTIDTLLCEGEVFENYSTAGEYTDVFTNSEGCDSIRILTLSFNSIYVPNVFSPNEDGINERFQIFSKDPNVNVKSYQIFNRWGRIIYSRNNFPISDSQNWWNGKAGRKGEEVNSGVYIYLIEVECLGKITQLIGDVTLIR